MNNNCKKNLVNKRIRGQIWSPIVLEVIIALYLLPVTVIDQLDSMKKESSNARDAIRWLEAEFRKGNMWVFWVWGVRAPAGNMSNGVISSAYSVYISLYLDMPNSGTFHMVSMAFHWLKHDNSITFCSILHCVAAISIVGCAKELSLTAEWVSN